MEENKNLTPDKEVENKNTSKKSKSLKPFLKKKLIKNHELFKRGSFSLALTAAVIVGVIIINILVGALSNRFILEFDMSKDKVSSITKENVEYIKKIDEKVDIIFCSDIDSYVGGYNEYYAQSLGVSDANANSYYDQTIKLIERYGDYNKNLNINFVDTQSSEFTSIASEYSNSTLNYGDIIVAHGEGANKRFKIIGYKDIYSLKEDTTYAQYGYTINTVSGNNIESALTSAIAYVLSDVTKKVGIVTGHSDYDYTENLQTTLKANNFEIEIIDDPLITSISNELDAIIIAGPTKDFLGSELDAISKFLENDDNLSKGLMFFAEASAPYLTNLYDFLAQWGIIVDEGVLFETNESNRLPDDPFTIGLFSSGKDDISSDVGLCITSYNLPFSVGEATTGIQTTSLIDSSSSVVVAPKGTPATWDGHKDYERGTYSGIIQAEKSTYNDDNKKISSYVMAFSSVSFIYSDYIEETGVSNKDITFAVTERAAGSDGNDIKFISKKITNESYSTSVTESTSNAISLIFMILIPLCCIVTGIVVYIRRRNS